MRKRRTWLSLLPAYFLIMVCLLLFALGGSKAISAYSENLPINNRKCIIIDAGHGGVDGGAISCTGVNESKINLEIACKLNDLMHLIGLDTKMIRSTDRSVHTQGNSIAQKKISDLKQRVKLVNETPNALLVSIHQNNFSDNRYSGAQVFYSNANNSEQLAKELQAAFIQALPSANNRQAKKADGVYLMKNIACPGVLIECGFLSNPEEEAKLRDESYQKKLCCIIAVTISNYLDHALTG